MSVVRTVDEKDQISLCEKSVYLGPIDSMWRMLSFPVHGQTPGIYRLNYHEPGKQPFAWPNNISDMEFQRRLANTTSEMMAWFNYNREHRYVCLYYLPLEISSLLIRERRNGWQRIVSPRIHVPDIQTSILVLALQRNVPNLAELRQSHV